MLSKLKVRPPCQHEHADWSHDFKQPHCGATIRHLTRGYCYGHGAWVAQPKLNHLQASPFGTTPRELSRGECYGTALWLHDQDAPVDTQPPELSQICRTFPGATRSEATRHTTLKEHCALRGAPRGCRETS